MRKPTIEEVSKRLRQQIALEEAIISHPLRSPGVILPAMIIKEQLERLLNFIDGKDNE